MQNKSFAPLFLASVLICTHCSGTSSDSESTPDIVSVGSSSASGSTSSGSTSGTTSASSASTDTTYNLCTTLTITKNDCDYVVLNEVGSQSTDEIQIDDGACERSGFATSMALYSTDEEDSITATTLSPTACTVSSSTKISLSSKFRFDLVIDDCSVTGDSSGSMTTSNGGSTYSGTYTMDMDFSGNCLNVDYASCKVEATLAATKTDDCNTSGTSNLKKLIKSGVPQLESRM